MDSVTFIINRKSFKVTIIALFIITVMIPFAIAFNQTVTNFGSPFLYSMLVNQNMKIPVNLLYIVSPLLFGWFSSDIAVQQRQCSNYINTRSSYKHRMFSTFIKLIVIAFITTFILLNISNLVVYCCYNMDSTYGEIFPNNYLFSPPGYYSIFDHFIIDNNFLYNQCCILIFTILPIIAISFGYTLGLINPLGTLNSLFIFAFCLLNNYFFNFLPFGLNVGYIFNIIDPVARQSLTPIISVDTIRLLWLIVPIFICSGLLAHHYKSR